MKSQLRGRVPAFVSAFLLTVGVQPGQWAAAAPQTDIFVTDLVLVSSQRFSRDLTDFTYRIKVTNQGGALVRASAFVRSTSANTVILDNEVVLGTVPRGTTLTSIDTFKLRQNRLVAFNPAHLIWRVDAQPANTRPVADAGPDQTVRLGATVTLDGTASTDADGNALRYRWCMTSRPAGSVAKLSSLTVGRPTFVVDRGGTYVFSLIVNDGQVDSLADVVRVSTSNSTPIANAGPDRTVPRGSAVTLDGSASSDPDFNSLTFSWSVIGAPSGSAAALDNPTSVAPVITLDRPGTYSFRLVVNDSQLTSAPDTVVISTENSAPVANAGDDQTGTVGIRVTLDAWHSSDADNDPVSASWTWVSRPAGSTVPLDTSDSFRPFFTPDRPGLYVAQLIVNDGFVDSAPDTTTVTIQVPPNRGPNAVNDTASTPEGTPVTIDVLANDSDPDPNTTLTLVSSTQPATGGAVVQVAGGLRFTPSAGFSGLASFQYTISDGDLQATAAVNVTVTSLANLAPIVNAGADLSASLPGAGSVSVMLNGAVSDDGRPPPANLTSIWSTVSGPGSVVFSAPNNAVSNASFTVAGIYVLRLTASDGALSAADDAQVIVSPPANTAPVLNAISNRTLNVGSTLSLQLIASDSDPLDTLIYSLPTAPSGVNLASPLLTWTPSNNQVGPHSFTARVRDAAGATDSKNFTVTVVSANRPPVFTSLTDDTTSTFARYAKTITATDPDGDAVTINVVDAPAGVTLTGSLLAWLPGATQIGSFTVKLRATDTQGAFAAGLFKVTVSATLRPIAHEDSYKVKVGAILTVPAPGVLTNDISPSGAPLNAVKRNDPALGTLNAFNADGSLTYTAPATNPRPPFTVTSRRISPEVFPNDLGAMPLLGDINRDGKPDLIYNGQGGPYVAISGGDGHVLWRAGGYDANLCNRSTADFTAWPQHVLGDIDDDDQLEFVYVSGCAVGGSLQMDRLTALRSDGTIKWGSAKVIKPYLEIQCHPTLGCPPTATPVEYAILFGSSLSIARLAANEAPTLMVRQDIPASAGGFYSITNGVVSFTTYGCRLATGLAADMGLGCSVTLLISTTDGSVQQVLRAPERVQFNRGIPTTPYVTNPPIAADLDGDGQVEIISGADVWKRVSGQWTLAWQSGAEPQQVAVADLDGDGRPEIIYALDRNQNLPPGTPYLGFTGILTFDANGNELRRIPLPTSFPGMLTVADANGDGVPEFLLTEGGNIHVVNTDGSFRWTYMVPDKATSSIAPTGRTFGGTNIVVYDLDGDGNKEVIFGSTYGVHILDAATGTEKVRFDGGYRLHFVSESNITFVTDWDNDGHADIVNIAGGLATAVNPGSFVLTATNNDWLPAGKTFNQVAFQPSSTNDVGSVLFDPSVTRSYRNPKQLGIVRDPRVTAGTSFEYAANDGTLDSSDAKVFLEIAPPNSPPVFTSRPPTAILAGLSPYVYQATAVDPDVGDTIAYSLSGFATNGQGEAPYITISASTGAVSILRQFGPYTARLTVTATDSQGASATQSFAFSNVTDVLPVPDVIGADIAAATRTLNAGEWQSGVLQAQFNALPAGTVIAQNPLAASAQPKGTTILLTVSKGPAPTVVPNIVGRSESSATTALIAAGFTGGVSREFSNSVDAGLVISQAVPAGTEQAGGVIGLVISAGSGLDLQLSRSVTPSNEAIPFTLVSHDVNGVVIASATITMNIVADSATSGTLPTIAGNIITSSINTRGRYRINMSDGSKTASALFVVVQPNTVSKPTQLAEFAQLDAVLGTMNSLLTEANVARIAGDLPLMSSRMIAWVSTWRTLNLNHLALAVPVAPEGGFPLEAEELALLGVTQSPDDVLNKSIIADANDDLLNIEEALRDGHTQTAQIVSMFQAFNARAERIRNVSPGEYGVTDAKGDYAVLMAHRIPRTMDALVEAVAHVFGLPPRTSRYPLLGRNADGSAAGNANDAFTARRWSEAPMVSRGSPSASAFTGAGSRPQAQVGLTLAEEITVTAVKAIVDAMGAFSYRKLLKAAAIATTWSAVVMVVAHHLKEFAGGADKTLTVTTGSSFSINVFRAQYSTIEGLGLNGRHPSLNKVMVLGPAIGQAAVDAAEKVKALGGAPSMAAGVLRARDLDEMQKGLKDLQDTADGVNDGLQGVLDAVTNIYQDPHERSAVSDCLFISGPLCRSIQYRNGFVPVYKPAGVNLPVPILFVSVNTETGETLVGTPEFLPSN